MDQKIVWNYHDDYPGYLLRLGMNQNKEIIIQCLKMKKFEKEILIAKISEDKNIKGILECNKENEVFFANLNTYEIRFDKEKEEYKLVFTKKGKETFGPITLHKEITEIDQEFKENYIKKYKDYVENLKKNNEKLEKELKTITDKNEKIKTINEDISKELKNLEKQQNESLNNPINNNL